MSVPYQQKQKKVTHKGSKSSKGIFPMFTKRKFYIKDLFTIQNLALGPRAESTVKNNKSCETVGVRIKIQK